MDSKCKQCGDDNDLFTAFTKYQICLKCTKQNHRKAVKKWIKKNGHKKVEEATQDALFEFWAKVVEIFPEAKGGDFPPDLTFEMDLTMEKMLHSWLYYNHPTYSKENE